MEVRFNWLTLYYRYQNIDPYFGTSFYTLDVSGPQPLIKKKKVILKNDYIHHVVDIYMISTGPCRVPQTPGTGEGPSDHVDVHHVVDVVVLETTFFFMITGSAPEKSIV